MRNLGKISLAASLAYVSACGISEDSKDNVTSPDLPELVGTWESNCADAAILDLAHTKKSLEFNGLSNFKKKESFYSAAECSDQGFEQMTEGSYSIEGELESDNSLEKINFTIEKSTLIPRSDTLVNVLNTTNFCGVENWAKDVETDITGKECLGVTNKQGDVIFDVYRINDSQLRLSEKFLFLKPVSADSQPESVSEKLVYTKQ